VPGGGDRRRPVSRRRAEAELGGEQVEGRQAVRELLRAGRRRVQQVLVDTNVDQAAPLVEIMALAEGKGVPVRRVPRARIEADAASDAPQGVIALADALQPVDLERLSAARPGRPAPFLVVLDGVTDPHNLGAVMRSALSAGATGLVIGRHRAARLTPTAVKAAAGAVEYLPVGLVGGIPAALNDLRNAGLWTVGLDASVPATVWDLEVATEAVALVLGAEGRGLSPLARQRCEVVVGIPMQGPLDSLNVSAAAAVVCFEVARRRGPGAARKTV
jgi:23S rRNA (guanosine2251-2'-O)-methyltransferase